MHNKLLFISALHLHKVVTMCRLNVQDDLCQHSAVGQSQIHCSPVMYNRLLCHMSLCDAWWPNTYSSVLVYS